MSWNTDYQLHIKWSKKTKFSGRLLLLRPSSHVMSKHSATWTLTWSSRSTAKSSRQGQLTTEARPQFGTRTSILICQTKIGMSHSKSSTPVWLKIQSLERPPWSLSQSSRRLAASKRLKSSTKASLQVNSLLWVFLTSQTTVSLMSSLSNSLWRTKKSRT